MIRVSKINKQKERWNKIKSKGKKRYVLNIIILYAVSSSLLSTTQLFILNKSTPSNRSIVIDYLMNLVVWSLLGLWIGIRTWVANIKKFEK